MAGCPRPFAAPPSLVLSGALPVGTFTRIGTTYTVDLVFDSVMDQTSIPTVASLQWEDGAGTSVTPVTSTAWLNANTLRIVATVGIGTDGVGICYYTSNGLMKTLAGYVYPTFDIEVPKAV